MAEFQYRKLCLVIYDRCSWLNYMERFDGDDDDQLSLMAITAKSTICDGNEKLLCLPC